MSIFKLLRHQSFKALYLFDSGHESNDVLLKDQLLHAC